MKIAKFDPQQPRVLVFTDNAGEPIRAIDFDEFPSEITRQLLWHGAKQKFGDLGAGTNSWDEHLEKINALVEAFEGGDWTVKGQAGSELARAIAEATGRPLTDVMRALDTKSKAEIKDLRKAPAVAKILARFAEEKARRKAEALAKAAEQAGEDTSDDLDDLLGF
jgi:hypothetical protein